MKVLYLTSQAHKSLTPSYPNYHRDCIKEIEREQPDSNKSLVGRQRSLKHFEEPPTGIKSLPDSPQSMFTAGDS